MVTISLKINLIIDFKVIELFYNFFYVRDYSYNYSFKKTSKKG